MGNYYFILLSAQKINWPFAFVTEATSQTYLAAGNQTNMLPGQKLHLHVVLPVKGA